MQGVLKDQIEAEESFEWRSIFVDVGGPRASGRRKELGGLFTARRTESVTLALSGSMAATAKPRLLLALPNL